MLWFSRWTAFTLAVVALVLLPSDAAPTVSDSPHELGDSKIPKGIKSDWLPGSYFEPITNKRGPQEYEAFKVRHKPIKAGEAEYYITIQNRKASDGGTMGEGGLFKLQFTGNRGTTEPLALARGPGSGDLIFRKTIDAKDVGDIKHVKLIRDGLVKNINVWVWVKVDVTHAGGGQDTYTGNIKPIACEPKCPMHQNIPLTLCEAEYC